MSVQPQNISKLNQLDVRKCWDRPPIWRKSELVAIPGFSCLYDLSGQRIEETRRDYIEGEKFIKSISPTQAPPYCKIPNDLTVIDEPILYGGQIGAHYGHFLSDHVSRMWPIFDEHFYKKIFLLPRSNAELNYSFVQRFLELTGIAKGKFITPTKPTLLRRVYIPAPSLQQISTIYPVQKTIHEHVARNSLLSSTGSNSIDAPVYLSRSKLNSANRLIKNEEALESKLSSFGYKIAYPEDLSLDDQISLFNSRHPVVGFIGSAFHSSLFTLNNEKRFCILSGENVNPRFLLIDAIKNYHSIYANVCMPTDSCKDGPARDVAFNIDAALDFLFAEGFI